MRLQNVFLAVTLLASSSSALAAPFTKLIVFGDSLSDNGNLLGLTGGLAPASPYFQGHASNGPVAVEYLSLALGLGPLVPAVVLLNSQPQGLGLAAHDALASGTTSRTRQA